jgi:hypothetical protein
MGCLKSKYQKQLTKEEQKQATENFLEYDFPLKFMVISTTVGTVLALLAIAFGILAVAYKSPLYQASTG